MRVALVHDWLTGMRGGERVLEVLAELFPEAPIYTLLHIPGSVSDIIERHEIRVSFLQHYPFIKKRYPLYLPLFPVAIEDFDLQEFDLVVSSSHCVAKGVIPHPGALHISYLHTPMRYVWDMYETYFSAVRVGKLPHRLISAAATWLRQWDVSSCSRVDHFIANSAYVQKRIKRYYNRDATVIHPPVDASRFIFSERDEGYYLVVSALVPYKRIDLAVEAFNKLRKRLVIVGDGQEFRSLKRIAGPTIEFAGWQPETSLPQYYANCRALVFPAKEDFGIVPLEAMASGKPVIAYGAGGALETVVAEGEIRTGVFFQEQSVDSLVAAVQKFETMEFNPELIREHALKFDKPIFARRLMAFIDQAVNEWTKKTVLGTGRPQHREGGMED